MTAAAASANADQITYWNEAAGPIWVAMQDDLDAQLQPLGSAAIDALAPKPGDRLIDVGCGCGATSLELARRVGAEGQVLGVDISAPMLAVARARAEAQGLGRARFLQADAQSHPFEPADAAFSRFGVMFFADPLAAFVNLRKALVPAGRLGFVCWQAAASNPWMIAPMAGVTPLLPAPPTPAAPGAPGPFAFADPDRLRGILEGAGFAGVAIEPHRQMIGWPDLDTAARVAIRVGPVGAAVREYPELASAISAAVRQTFEQHVTADGVRLSRPPGSSPPRPADRHARPLIFAAGAALVQTWPMKLSAAYSTISASSIAAVLDQRYEIAPVARCHLIHRGFNDTYELEGSDGRSYMARLGNRRFRGPANVDYETALLMHLHRAGIAVGVPLSDHEGRLWSKHDAPEGPRELAVFGRLNGRGLVAAVRRAGDADDQTLADVAALGDSLARIHLAGESFDGPRSLYRLERPLLVDGPLDQLMAVFGGEAEEDAREVAANLGARLEACAPRLSIGHCHGDNHGGNTFIAEASDGARVAGWFDFDDGGPGFLAYDLATFLWSLLLRTPAGDMTKEIPPIWRTFITAYRRVRTIPAPDYGALGVLVAIRHFWIMGNFASRLSNTPIPVDWFRQAMGLVRRWDDLVAPAVD